MGRIKQAMTPIAGLLVTTSRMQSTRKSKSESILTREVQGPDRRHAQELNLMLHPHSDLKRTRVHAPNIKPGDLVV